MVTGYGNNCNHDTVGLADEILIITTEKNLPSLYILESPIQIPANQRPSLSQALCYTLYVYFFI